MWILLEQVTDITAAQILAMSTVPVEIIPDPGAGKVIVPVSLSWDFLPGDTPFSAAGSITTDYEGGQANVFSAFNTRLNGVSHYFGFDSEPAASAAASDCAGAILASLASGVTSGNGTLRILAKYYVHVLQS